MGEKETGGDDFLLSLAAEPEEKEQPDILAIARQMRNTGLPYWHGGLVDQPQFFMMELQACHNAEVEFKKRIITNELALARWQEQQQLQGGQQ